jgi:hypothetical protein
MRWQALRRRAGRGAFAYPLDEHQDVIESRASKPATTGASNHANRARDRGERGVGLTVDPLVALIGYFIGARRTAR